MLISRGFKIQSFWEFHDIYAGLQTFLQNNCGPSSLKRPNKPSPFMVFQCTFVEKGYVESLILQKFGIKEHMRVMICFSNIPNKVNNKKMIYNLFGSILVIWKIGKPYMMTLE